MGTDCGGAVVTGYRAACHKTEYTRRPGGGSDEKSCDLVTDDPVLLGKHMQAEHGVKGALNSWGCSSASSWKPFDTTPWKPPRPTTNPFGPKSLEPGADVSWRQLVDGDQLTRSGQVWSLAPGGIWVIPFTLLDGEHAVCLRVRRSLGQVVGLTFVRTFGPKKVYRP